MRFSSLTAATAISAIAIGAVSAQNTPGYITNFTTETSNNLTFGTHYAVLNLDLIDGIVGGVANSTEGKAFISSISQWTSAVHALNPPPLTIWTRIYFSNAYTPELGINTPFGKVAAGFGNITVNSTTGQLYPAFQPTARDVVLPKTRYFAGAGNALEEILSSNKIDTVILSGIRTSGVILSTASRLFDANYKVYVITNNTIESPPNGPAADQAIKQYILPKLPVGVITLEQALSALNRSGPVVY